MFFPRDLNLQGEKKCMTGAKKIPNPRKALFLLSFLSLQLKISFFADWKRPESSFFSLVSLLWQMPSSLMRGKIGLRPQTTSLFSFLYVSTRRKKKILPFPLSANTFTRKGKKEGNCFIFVCKARTIYQKSVFRISFSISIKCVA